MERSCSRDSVIRRNVSLLDAFLVLADGVPRGIRSRPSAWFLLDNPKGIPNHVFPLNHWLRSSFIRLSFPRSFMIERTRFIPSNRIANQPCYDIRTIQPRNYEDFYVFHREILLAKDVTQSGKVSCLFVQRPPITLHYGPD